MVTPRNQIWKRARDRLSLRWNSSISDRSGGPAGLVADEIGRDWGQRSTYPLAAFCRSDSLIYPGAASRVPPPVGRLRSRPVRNCADFEAVRRLGARNALSCPVTAIDARAGSIWSTARDDGGERHWCLTSSVDWRLLWSQLGGVAVKGIVIVKVEQINTLPGVRAAVRHAEADRGLPISGFFVLEES